MAFDPNEIKKLVSLDVHIYIITESLPSLFSGSATRTCHSRTQIAADTMRLMSKGRSVSLSWILVDALLGISPLVNNFMQNSSSTWCWCFFLDGVSVDD